MTKTERSTILGLLADIQEALAESGTLNENVLKGFDAVLTVLLKSEDA